MDDGKRGLEENVANVEVLPMTNPTANERKTAMKKMMMAVSKEKSNMAESDGGE